MNDYSTILLDVTDSVATLTLNRPEKRNALTDQMMDEIREAIGSLEGRKARALLIDAAGASFCAGADNSGAARAIGDAGLDPAPLLEKHSHPTMAALVALKIPVVAAVQGAATGIGVGIALAADFVLASPRAIFLVGYAKIGLVPDGGTGWLVTRLVGRTRAAEIMMLNESLDAERALELGLVHRVVAEDALAGEARALAKRLAEGPTRALGLIRRQMFEAEEQTFEQALAGDLEKQHITIRSADAREGIAALVAKRPPQFTGR